MLHHSPTILSGSPEMLALMAGRAKVRVRYSVECVDRAGRKKWSDGFYNRVVTEGLNTLLNRSFDAVAADVNWYVGLIGAGTGTVAVSASSSSVTGTSTAFANGDNGSDIIIVGAGTSGADHKTTVSGNPASATALTLASNASTTVSGASYAIAPRAADVMNSKSFNETSPYSNAVRPTWTKNGAASGGAMSNSSAKAAFTVNTSGRAFGCFLSNNSTKGGTTGLLFGGGLFTISRVIESGDTLNVQVDISITAS